MATVAMQRDLVVALKKETILNVGILSKLQPIPSDLGRQIFKENALDKPTQNLFNHLSHYLVSIIDNQVGNSLPWPLYDTKTERAYRSELSSFITDYSSKGLLSPVMSSYLVNPGCYKVTMLMFQMSQLAVQRVLQLKMNKDSQKILYNNMTENYRSLKEDFIENIEMVTVTMSSKFSNYLRKRKVMEKIAEVFRTQITKMENKMSSLKTQKYIDDLVDDFLKKCNMDELMKTEILNVKNIYKPSKFFEDCLSETDIKINEMELQWEKKMNPFLQTCTDIQHYSKMLIERQTGVANKSSYTLEYNPKTDDINTEDLQAQVNSEQKYILKNITKDDKLIFPNLIRAFLISICFILKNAEIGDDIYKFNEYLDGGKRNFAEIVSAMRILLDRVMNAEAKLQPTQTLENQSISLQEFTEIPPLPDLSDLKMGKELQSQINFDTFTPLTVSKHQFNLRRRVHTSFAKPQPRSLLIAPFYQGPRDDFLKSLISCRISSYDRSNTTQNLNVTVMSQTNFRNNETIAECSSGFTKQQIFRLLSTKKSSSSKKFKYKTERPDINVKKGGLFNESLASSVASDSNGLYRSHSSPNLFENRERRSKIPIPRKLSIMQEDCPLLEVSGISALEKDSSYGTPEGVLRLESSRKLFDATSLPVISITSEPVQVKNVDTGLSTVNFADLNLSNIQENILEKEDTKTETPKNNSQLIRKTSSLEKIINRFKKVRASVLPSDKQDEEGNEFKTIVEEKENFNMVNVDVFTANRILLPDLLSPSCSLPKKSAEYLDQTCCDMDEVPCKKPRESLGTALGVDHTFLDQFDLID